jgi:hypothetical protein
VPRYLDDITPKDHIDTELLELALFSIDRDSILKRLNN